MADPRILGANPTLPLDAVFVNSPLKDYDVAVRHNDFTLPVLGLGYIATYARNAGFNVGVLDIESLGLGLSDAAELINEAAPRWVGLNLLAPTYNHSVTLLSKLDPEIKVMLGGHQAKAMPDEILADDRIASIDALVVGEGETRAAALLGDLEARSDLPGVRWRGDGREGVCEAKPADGSWMAPQIDKLPFVDRRFFSEDPYRAPDGRLEANMVGSRGCPYDCSFCGAAISANPDVLVRTRDPEDIVAEMERLEAEHGVTAFRFVDDLFLAHPRFMQKCLSLFIERGIGDRFVWDATGRINVLDKVGDNMIDLMKASGCREVALGIESGSERVLKHIGKRINPEMTERVVRRLNVAGIKVKGYAILGFPTETRDEMNATVSHIRRLWDVADEVGGDFRASVFEFRPYPGTPEWTRLMSTGKYSAEQLLTYEHVDLTEHGANDAMRERDEFNFSVGIQFGEPTVAEIRAALSELTKLQDGRKIAVARQAAPRPASRSSSR